MSLRRTLPVQAGGADVGDRDDQPAGSDPAGQAIPGHGAQIAPDFDLGHEIGQGPGWVSQGLPRFRRPLAGQGGSWGISKVSKMLIMALLPPTGQERTYVNPYHSLVPRLTTVCLHYTDQNPWYYWSCLDRSRE